MSNTKEIGFCRVFWRWSRSGSPIDGCSSACVHCFALTWRVTQWAMDNSPEGVKRRKVAKLTRRTDINPGPNARVAACRPEWRQATIRIMLAGAYVAASHRIGCLIMGSTLAQGFILMVNWIEDTDWQWKGKEENQQQRRQGPGPGPGRNFNNRPRESAADLESYQYQGNQLMWVSPSVVVVGPKVALLPLISTRSTNFSAGR